MDKCGLQTAIDDAYETIAALSKRIELLEVENAKLRAGLPVIDDATAAKWRRVTSGVRYDLEGGDNE